MQEYILNVEPHETRIALLEDKQLVELTVERQENRSIVGNIYRGRVDSVVPGIQAAFVDIGFEKNGFLYVADIAAQEGTGDFDLEDTPAMPKSRSRRAKRPPIETILKKNQHIMVQVTKDRLGTKGVRLTNYVTLPGRYSVLMPTVQQTGVSRKIENERERDRLKRIVRALREPDAGLILRTAGEGKGKTEIKDDVKYLSRMWQKIKRRMEEVKSAGLLHEDLGPVLRMVRDGFTQDIDRLTIDDEESFKRILEFLDILAPNLKRRCKLYNGKRPIFERLGVEEQINRALNRKVMLPSGGHICIDQTEALIAIDVNTGKFTGKSHLEETVFKTNLEAADAIAHQVRLRDMGGIIVLDFIDMELVRNRRELIRRLQDALKVDHAKTTVSDVNDLGMIEMTRKRVKHNLMKALSQPCPYCEGSGLVRSVTTMTFDVLRQLQSLLCRTKEKRILVQLPPDVARRLRTENKPLVDALATHFEREISIESVSDFHIHDVKFLSGRTREEIKAARAMAEELNLVSGDDFSYEGSVTPREAEEIEETNETDVEEQKPSSRPTRKGRVSTKRKREHSAPWEDDEDDDPHYRSPRGQRKISAPSKDAHGTAKEGDDSSNTTESLAVKKKSTSRRRPRKRKSAEPRSREERNESPNEPKEAQPLPTPESTDTPEGESIGTKKRSSRRRGSRGGRKRSSARKREADAGGESKADTSEA